MLSKKLEIYKNIYKQLKSLEEEIKCDVFRLQQSVSIEGVYCKYNSGRKTFLYKEEVEKCNAENLNNLKNKYEKVTYDYKKICEELGIDVEYKTGKETVTIKVD